MRRVLLVALWAVLGFMTGWLVFAWPFGGSEAERIERLALQEYGINGKSATCEQREYPSNVWDCKVVNAELGLALSTRATVRADGSVSFTRFSL